MIRILIVDDEVAASNMLRLLIEKILPLEKDIRTCNDPNEALNLLAKWSPSLLMLDIEMPAMNGFDLLNKAVGQQFDVIFTTAYDSYAIKAIRFSALDYLLKPIDIHELQSALNKHIIRLQTDFGKSQQKIDNLIRNLKNTDTHDFKLALTDTEGIYFVQTNTIIRCEAENNYTRFYFTDRRPLLVSRTLKEFEEILSEHHFLRVHKSHLVNEKFVSEFKREGLLALHDGSIIPISRRKKELFSRKP